MELFKNSKLYIELFSSPAQLGLFIILTNHLLKENLDRTNNGDMEFEIEGIGYESFEPIFQALIKKKKAIIIKGEIVFAYLKEFGFDSAKSLSSSQILIYKDIFNAWTNHETLIPHKKLNDGMVKAIKKALKTYDTETIKLVIGRYAAILRASKKGEYYFSYKWRLDQFLNQDNAFSNFLDDGSQWVNFSERKVDEKSKSQMNKSQESYNDLARMIMDND